MSDTMIETMIRLAETSGRGIRYQVGEGPHITPDEDARVEVISAFSEPVVLDYGSSMVVVPVSREHPCEFHILNYGPDPLVVEPWSSADGSPNWKFTTVLRTHAFAERFLVAGYFLRIYIPRKYQDLSDFWPPETPFGIPQRLYRPPQEEIDRLRRGYEVSRKDFPDVPPGESFVPHATGDKT